MTLRISYLTIGQMAELVDLPQSVLRYWESVFDQLNPAKSPGGNRRYAEKDIEIVQRIKKLLYDQGFTIKGANKIINDEYGNKEELSGITSEVNKIIAGDEKQPTKNYKNTDKIFISGEIITELKKIITILS
ncbi:MAG: MerR family transcriptional regulator [Calditrichaceae bacterium]|nr:MerR family transcriptional regulator [Calditrichaceae bacterium]MBN2709876.1 MerR family transcriptional regulator [Calditrichaceae bacterium]RQV92632.1 MAG: MerR family transcriptional regulator [Calditrichota bacterium]